MAEPAELLQTALAARYTFEGLIGQGGMATVYRAVDLARGRPVAIKVLRPELSAVLGVERFLREIAVTARLDHPHIVPLFDSGEAAGMLYYAMPLIDGESIAERIKRQGPLPITDAVGLAIEVAGALQYAHERGVIHRDIKPDNIMISAGHARVADFGIARAVTRGAGDKLTGTGFGVGTPHYMSPEQSAGGEVDARSDLYSLASVLYEMLAGEPPYDGPTIHSVIAKRWKEPVPRVSTGRDTVWPALEAVVTRGLAKDPVDRYSTAAEFAEALRQAGRPSIAAAGPRPRRLGLRAVGAITALVVGAVAIGVVLARPSQRARPVDRIALVPFEAAAKDSVLGYLMTGMYDALNAEISQLQSVVVIASGSVARVATGARSDREIGAELQADGLIRGRVVWIGDSVGLTVDLIDPKLETQQTTVYRSSVGQAMTLPSQVGRWIGLRLGRERTARSGVTSPASVDSTAFESYLKARHHASRGTPADLDQADKYLDQSLKADPNYAPAHALLAQQQVIQMFRGLVPPNVAFDRAKASARRAIALDEGLAEAHYQLGYVLALYDWDWGGAEREFRRAVELNPSDANAHAWYGFYLSWMNRPKEAVALARRAATLDPVSVLAMVNEATVLLLGRMIDSAVAKAEASVAFDPQYGLAYERLGLAYDARNDYPKAIEAYRKALGLFPGDPQRLASLAGAYAKIGRTDTARVVLADLLARERRSFVTPLALATLYVGLGEPDHAIDWIEQGFQGRSPEMVALQVSPVWESLRGQPRFQAVLRRMKFP